MKLTNRQSFNHNVYQVVCALHRIHLFQFSSSQNLFLTFIVAIFGWFTPMDCTPPNCCPFLCYWFYGVEPKAPPGGLLFPCDTWRVPILSLLLYYPPFTLFFAIYCYIATGSYPLAHPPCVFLPWLGMPGVIATGGLFLAEAWRAFAMAYCDPI